MNRAVRATVWAVAALFPGLSAAEAACTGPDLFARLEAEKPKVAERIRLNAILVPNGRGLFWRIEKPGVRPSHILGYPEYRTLADTIPDAAKKAIARARLFMTDSTAELRREIEAELRSGGIPTTDAQRSPFERYMSARDAEKIRTIVARFGVDPKKAHQLVPWILMNMLDTPPCEFASRNEPDIAARIESHAIRANIPRRAFRDVRTALGMLNTLPERHARTFIIARARLSARLPAAIVAQYRFYRAGEIGLAWEFDRWLLQSVVAPQDADALIDDVFSRIHGQMNRNALKGLVRELDRGNVFVAVTANALPYAYGLIELLRARGYTLTPVK